MDDRNTELGMDALGGWRRTHTCAGLGTEQLGQEACLMGWVQYRLGNLKEALTYLRRAYQLTQDGEVAAHLAEVLWVADKKDEATALWREALQRWPDNPALLESIKRLQPGLLP